MPEIKRVDFKELYRYYEYKNRQIGKKKPDYKDSLNMNKAGEITRLKDLTVLRV